MISKSVICSSHPDACIDLLFLGSSHFSKHRHFMENMLTRKFPPSIRSVQVISIPGGQMDFNARCHVFEVAQALPDDRHLLVISMMACNGVRTPEDINEVKREHELLVDRYTDNNRVFILLCGLIPRPRFPARDPLFKKMDDLLVDVVCFHPKEELLDFFDTASLFFEEGFLNNQLFDKDGVHLNGIGAYILILNLVKKVKEITYETFPYTGPRVNPLRHCPSPPRPLEHQSPPPLPPSPDHLPPTPPPPPPPCTPPPLPSSHLPCLPAPQPNTRINRTIKLGDYEHIKF